MRRPPPVRRVTWNRTHRFVPTRYPPIQLFERIADPEDWDALVEIESLTNERIRDEIGEIRLVAPEDRVSGAGASWVMAAFTHVGYASRFTDGSYGVYYTARTRDCALAETTFHWGRFFAATREPACELDVRMLVAAVDAVLHDLRGGRRRWRDVYDRDDYRAGQALARRLRAAGSNGLVYESVRLSGGECVAAFRPRVMSRLPRGDRYLQFHWDGTRIDRYFDYQTGRWTAAPLSGRVASGP